MDSIPLLILLSLCFFQLCFLLWKNLEYDWHLCLKCQKKFFFNSIFNSSFHIPVHKSTMTILGPKTFPPHLKKLFSPIPGFVCNSTCTLFASVSPTLHFFYAFTFNLLFNIFYPIISADITPPPPGRGVFPKYRPLWAYCNNPSVSLGADGAPTPGL